jgi:hypothetical protein
MAHYETMGKEALRGAFRELGLKYSGMTVADMRDTLIARSNIAATVKSKDEKPKQPKAAPATPRATKIEKVRVTQNGITRPSAGGKCAAVWDVCDKLVAEGITPTSAHMRQASTDNGWNENNTNIEFYRWRKFVGYTKGSK